MEIPRGNLSRSQNGILTQRYHSKAHAFSTLPTTMSSSGERPRGVACDFLPLWNSNLHTRSHTQHACSLHTWAICAISCKFLEGRVSAVVAQCLTYDLVHCLLNDLGEGRGSVMCRIGEEARTSISKGYFCTKVEPEPLDCPQCAAPPGSQVWATNSPLGTGGDWISLDTLLKLAVGVGSRCLSCYFGTRSRKFDLGQPLR